MSELAVRSSLTSPVKLAKSVASNAKKRFFEAESLVQAGKTPFDLIYQGEIAKLRYYPPINKETIKVGDIDVDVAKTTHRIPLVIVAPLAANMYIYDLFQERSLVRYLRAKGFELYLIDWGVPEWSQNHFTLATYFAEKMPRMLAEVRKHSGQQQLSLHGWSLGGLFSTCYSSLGDPDIVNLTLVGAPCDYHANGELGKQYQRVEKQLSWIKKTTGWQIHNSPKRWWRSPGWMNSLAFKLTNPIGSIQGYLDLLKNLHDEEYVISHATNAAFLDDMLAYPGGTGQDIVQYLVANNVLANGKLPMRETEGAVSNIKSNILMVCGDNDPIVTRENSVALLDLVKSEDQTVLDVAGGHMGILSGSKAPSEIWPKVADWLAARSN